MIKRNLLKGAAVFLSCCLVFTSAGCGKKSKTVTTESTTKAVTEQETKKNAGSEEQVTIAVKDSEGNTVEVAGIVETKDSGEKVVIIQDRDGNSNNSGNNGSSSSDNGSNSAPSEADTKPSTPNIPSHEHNWEPVYDYIPHEEVKEKVWVVDKAAWDEPVYKTVHICLQCEHGECSVCRERGVEQSEFSSSQERREHQYDCQDNGGSCMNSTNRKKKVDYIHHDEEGHYETVTVTDAYVEQKLVGYKCSSCGETK